MKPLKPKVRVFRRKNEQFLLAGVAGPSFEFGSNESNASEIVRILRPSESESEIIQSLSPFKYGKGHPLWKTCPGDTFGRVPARTNANSRLAEGGIDSGMDYLPWTIFSRRPLTPGSGYTIWIIHDDTLSYRNLHHHPHCSCPVAIPV